MEETTYTLPGMSDNTIEIMINEVNGEAINVYTYRDCLKELPDELLILDWEAGRSPLFYHVHGYHVPTAALVVKNLSLGSN